MPIITEITPGRGPKMNVKDSQKEPSVVTHQQTEDRRNEKVTIITDITPGRGPKMNVKDKKKPKSLITLKYGLTRKVWVDVYSKKKMIVKKSYHIQMVFNQQYAMTRKVWVNDYTKKRRGKVEKETPRLEGSTSFVVLKILPLRDCHRPRAVSDDETLVGPETPRSVGSTSVDIRDNLPMGVCHRQSTVSDDETRSYVSEDETLVGPETPRSEGSTYGDIRDIRVCHRHRTKTVRFEEQTSWVSTDLDSDSESLSLTLSSSTTEMPTFKTIDLLVYKCVYRTTVLPPPEALAYPTKLRHIDSEGIVTEYQLFESEDILWMYAEEDRLAVKKEDIQNAGVDINNFYDPAFVSSVRRLATKTTDVTAGDIIEATPFSRSFSETTSFRRSVSDMSLGSLGGGVTGSEMNLLFRSSSGSRVGSGKPPQSIPISPRTKRAKTRGPVVASRYLNKPSADKGRKATGPLAELPKNSLGNKPVPGKRTPPEGKGTGKTGPGKVSPTSPRTQQTAPKTKKEAPLKAKKAPQVSSGIKVKKASPLAVDAKENLPLAVDAENAPPPLSIEAKKPSPLSIECKENLPPAIDAENVPPLASDAENAKANKAPSKKKSILKETIATICTKTRKQEVEKKKKESVPAFFLKKIHKIVMPEPQKAVIYPKPKQGQLESYRDPDDYIFPTLPELAPLGRFCLGISRDPAVCPEKRLMTKKLVQRCEKSRDVFESRRDPDDDASNRNIKSPKHMRTRTLWTDNLDYILILVVILIICYSLHLIFTSAEPVETFLSVSGLYIFLILAYFIYAFQ